MGATLIIRWGVCHNTHSCHSLPIVPSQQAQWPPATACMSHACHNAQCQHPPDPHHPSLSPSRHDNDRHGIYCNAHHPFPNLNRCNDHQHSSYNAQCQYPLWHPPPVFQSQQAWQQLVQYACELCAATATTHFPIWTGTMTISMACMQGACYNAHACHPPPVTPFQWHNNHWQ